MLMRAISVRQPWAWLLLHKGKDVENRSWALPARYVGDPLLLHAGKTEAPVPPELRPLLTEYEGRLGGVVGRITFGPTTQGHPSRWAEPGARHWPVLRSQPLPFFACRGRLGIFKVDYPFPLEALI